MSLTSVVAMLQAALTLLTLAQGNPSLPQALRDNAIQVAQHAIQQATVALSLPTAPTQPISSPTDTGSLTVFDPTVAMSALFPDTTTLSADKKNYDVPNPDPSKFVLGRVSFDVKKDAASAAACITGGNSTTVINGITYSVFNSSTQSLGQFADITTYKTVKNTWCYSITSTLSGTSFNTLSASDAVQAQADYTRIKAANDKVVQSVKIYDLSVTPATPTVPASPSGQASLSVTSVSGLQVTIAYRDLPVHSYVNLLWENGSGQWEETSQVLLPSGGSGSAVITQGKDAPSGYYKVQGVTTDDMYVHADSDSFVYRSPITALNCTLTASPSTVFPGQSVVLTWSSSGSGHATWIQDTSANLLGLPYADVYGDGSATFIVSGKSGVITPTLKLTRDDGTSGTCTTAITVTAPATPNGPSITISNALPTSVTISYANLPANAQIRFVNAATGVRYDAQSTMVWSGGSGAVSIQEPSDLAHGTYFLRVTDYYDPTTVIAESSSFTAN